MPPLLLAAPPGDAPAAALLGAVALAFLAGSIPFGLLVGRALGRDLRAHGSGNIGATNALRVLGKPAGVAVLALDALKGWAPTALLPPALAAHGHAPPTWLPLALALASVLGHVFPPWLRFRGGKGVATSAGAFLAVHPAAFVMALGAFVAVVATTRIVSLGSILAAATLPVFALLWDGPAAWGEHLLRTVALVLAAGLVILKHRGNLARLRAGSEPRLGQRASPGTDAQQAEPPGPAAP